ncbi:M28 family metallopeptidase [Vibrio campbellii]|uniref:M28 family metallopeptidase n=1 Tax=Vibrio campbellii TaxID=680 RepID=UPI0037360CFF
MKKSLLAMALLSGTVAASESPLQEEVWITTDADAQHLAIQHGAVVYSDFFGARPAIVAKIPRDKLATLSSHMHHDKHRCGGYMVHPDKASAMKAAAMPTTIKTFNKPTISHHEKVETLINQVEPTNLVKTIEDMTSFTNRFYTTPTGIEASNWLLERWIKEIEGVSYASAVQIPHAGFPQKSVEVTLLGAKYPEEIIVVGGHLDSTAGTWTEEHTISPGADDDASGIATVTEALRLMIASGVQPDRTIKFYGYAAEEVGLRGSQGVVSMLSSQGANVLSALQLDMTNYNGSAHDITFITDYTDSNLTAFLAELIDEYAPEITYAFDRCGYACSDHASWHNAGYPAAMPFESMFEDYNPNIHTQFDTLENADPTATHASNFAKLAVAYLVESSMDSVSGVTPLQDGEPVDNLQAGYGEEQFFTFETQEAGQVTITMSGPRSGDADLFVKYNDSVSVTNFDCRPFQNGSNEQCVLNKPAGMFNIMIRGYRNFDQTSIVASFEKTAK